MPQNTFQRIIFTAVMAIFMTYGMIVYNISTSLGQMSDIIFAEALHELVFGHVEVEHYAHRLSAFGQHLLEGLSLGYCAWEAVEDDAL